MASIGKDTLTSALAQHEQMKGIKRGQMSNDMLLDLQKQTYNNSLNESANGTSSNRAEVLSLGPGIAFPVCKEFH